MQGGGGGGGAEGVAEVLVRDCGDRAGGLDTRSEVEGVEVGKEIRSDEERYHGGESSNG